MSNCLRQPGQILNSPKVYESYFQPTYYTSCTVTNPAAVTKSIGLLANAPLSWFLHRHQDNFIVT